MEFITIIFICVISDLKQTSDGRREHSDERSANKCVCLVDSIQKNPSTMSDNHLAITLVNGISVLLAE